MSAPGKSSGIILAGGGSRRMGRDKLSLEVGGIPILRRVYDVLDAACDEVLVVAGAYELSGLPERARVVRDLRPAGSGPLAGLESGLYYARHEQTFVAAGDMPFVVRDLILVYRPAPGYPDSRRGAQGRRAP